MHSSRQKCMEDGVQHTFLFADLVGYTAFTERVGDDAAADVAVAFQAAAAHMASDFDCEVIKNLGDAVMVRGEDAAHVVGLALQIARELSEEAWCPPLRMGVHSGTAVRGAPTGTARPSTSPPAWRTRPVPARCSSARRRAPASPRATG